MIDRPDDRPAPPSIETSDDPRLFVLVNGEKFPRPGLETYFADSGAVTETCSCHPVVAAYCSCNKVRTCSCVPVCTCEAVCSCVAHKQTVCTCDSVRKQTCTCNPVRRSVCTCESVRSRCSCDNHSSGGGRVVTGCRCAPVH